MNKVKIIAEIGVNHDGKFDKAIKLINSAKKIVNLKINTKC